MPLRKSIFLKGFADKIEEFEKADRETRNRYVEASAKSITDLIAKNKLKRQARIERITEPIQKAVNAGLSITNAAKAHKLGIIPSLLKIKLDNTSADLNKFLLYQLSIQVKYLTSHKAKL